MTHESTPPAPTRGARFRGWRWAAFLTMMLGYVGYYLCRANLQAATPLICDAWHVDLVALGWVSTVSTVVYGIGKFTHGFFAEHFGGRAMFLVGLIGAAIFSSACGLYGSVGVLVILWSLNRFIQAGGWVGMVQISAQWYPRARIGTVMSVLSLSWLVGDWGARELTGAIVGAGLGWRMVFFIPAAVVAVYAILAFFTLKGSPEAVGEPPLTVEEAGPQRGDGMHWPIVQALLANPRFHILAVMSVLLTALRQAAQDWSSSHLQSIGLGQADAMAASGIFPAAGIVGTLCAGLASDYLFRGRRAPICIFLLGCLALGLGILAVTPDVTPLQGRLLWGLCGFGLLGPYSLLGGAVSVDVGGRQAAAVAAGLVDGVGYLVGSILGGVGAAAVVQSQGWPFAFGIMTVFAVVAVAAAYTLSRNERAA